MASALSGDILTSNTAPKVLDVLARIPLIALWNWLNLFLFDVDNQFQPSSVLEDTINKPWRVVPSKRLSAADARRWLLLIIPSVFAATLVLGGTRQAVTLMVMTWMYNDLDGAANLIWRNILNALGYMCYSSGSMIVAAGYQRHELNEKAEQWLQIIGAIIFTTLQMQDMPDVEGDMARGRNTVPLVYGDFAARCSIGLPIFIWSFLCPTFWRMDLPGYVLPVAIGSWLVGRLFMCRNPVADGITWKMWCLWITTIYLLPLHKRHEDSIGLLFSRVWSGRV